MWAILEVGHLVAEGLDLGFAWESSVLRKV